MVIPAEGDIAVKLARDVLDRALGQAYGRGLVDGRIPQDLPPVFSEKRGLFVTLETYPERSLRGCIGFVRPVYALGEGVVRGAWLAAREDPRFEPVSPDELRSLTVEVSILTPLERIRVEDPRSLPDQVEVGRDGLYVTEGDDSGLLLPQVPVDEHWDSRQFLEGVCLKAGLRPSSWTRKGPQFFRFRSEIFAEETPRGKTVVRELRPASG